MAIVGDTASTVLRRGLLWLAALTSAGIGVELAADRHWTQPVQLIAWAALGAVALALLLCPNGRPGERSDWRGCSRSL